MPKKKPAKKKKMTSLAQAHAGGTQAPAGREKSDWVKRPKRAAGGNIGIFCENGAWIFYHPYFGRLFSGFAEAAESDHRRVVLYLPEITRTGHANPERHETHLRGLEELEDGKVEAAIVIGGRQPEGAQLAKLKKLPIPIVLVSNNAPVPGVFQLASGAYERTHLAAERLYAEGRMRVGLVGLYQGSTYNRRCLQGLREATWEAKKNFDTEQVQEITQWDISQPWELSKCIERQLALGCDSLIVSDVAQAMVILDILEKKGIKVPSQMALVSFGPLPEAVRLKPNAMRLMNADLIEEGKRAYFLLREALQGAPPRAELIRWLWPEIEAPF